MRNRKLVLTLLALAVLIVGVVLLLRQSNTQNDTSLANNGTQPKTEKPTKTDPEKAKKTDPEKAKKKRSSKPSIITNGKTALPKPKGITTSAKKPSDYKAEEIRRVKAEMQQTTDPAYKAKLQKRLNTLK